MFIVCLSFVMMGLCLVSLVAEEAALVRTSVASVWISKEGYVQPPYRFPIWGEDGDNEKKIPKHDTQILYNDRVQIIEVDASSQWAKVRIERQPIFRKADDAFGPYVGWVKMDDLLVVGNDNVQRPTATVCKAWGIVYKEPHYNAEIITKVSLGTRLHAKPFVTSPRGGAISWLIVHLPDGMVGFMQGSEVINLSAIVTLSEEEQRDKVIQAAQALLGHPYCWGGSSAFDPTCIDTHLTSLDCSGLTMLSYSVIGRDLARNASCQLRRARVIEPCDVKKGDLIFIKSARYNYERVNHVLMALDYNLIIEASPIISDAKVRIISQADAFGAPLTELKNGQRIEDRGIEIYCGSFFGG